MRSSAQGPGGGARAREAEAMPTRGPREQRERESIYRLLAARSPEPDRRRPALHRSKFRPRTETQSPCGASGRPCGKASPEAGGAATAPRRMRERRKAPLVPRSEVPVMGLLTDKSFTVANAREVIAVRHPHVAVKLPFVRKPEFGRVPKYLTHIKAQLAGIKQHQEEERQRQLSQQAGKARPMPEDERQDLLRKLKTKWARVNAVFQTLPVVIDTISKKRLKECLSQQLASLEADIRLLSAANIVIVDDR